MAARFFCDNCGTEVNRNAGRCPRCGRYFMSVRCPRCSFTGEEQLFRAGCPVCGYCVPPEEPGKAPLWPLEPRGMRPAGKLPFWVYILAAAGLAVVIAVLVFTLR